MFFHRRLHLWQDPIPLARDRGEILVLQVTEDGCPGQALHASYEDSVRYDSDPSCRVRRDLGCCSKRYLP